MKMNSTLNRRRWLQMAGSAATALGTGSIGNLLMATQNARAAGDYKALVCVFLYGGNDGLNSIVPTDTTRYNQYSGVRKALALPHGSLVGLGNSSYGLHPSLARLEPIWSAGHLAPVFNVGPLYAPVTKAEFMAAPASSPLRPEALFSHSDQQTLWETSGTSSSWRTGWGGRASVIMGTANPVISVGGNGRFGLSLQGAPLVLPGPGSTMGVVGIQGADLTYGPAARRKEALDLMYSQSQDLDLARAMATQHQKANDAAARLSNVVKVQPSDANASAGINAGFANVISSGQLTTGLAKQLYQIAKLVEANATVGGNRQIFFATLSGFDTHAGQIGNSVTTGLHAELLKELGDALAAFNAAMANIGMGQQVTTFTQSDFGRTFRPNNSSGTDHAWGNMHFVLGGAVKGGTTYGAYPELVLGGPNDAGDSGWEKQGRWIPTASVDQYAATLLRWFGAGEAQLDNILPNLRNFGSQRSLGFV
jgi:uncharacterized protein (DUF1501 family)